MVRRVGWFAFAGVIGCASAEDPASSGAGPTPPPATTQGGSTTEPGPMTTGIDPPEDDGNSADASTSSGGDDTTTGGMGESSSEGTSGEDETTGDPGMIRCDFATTCNGADTAGGVSGDTSTPPVTVMGDEPMWVQVQVSENDDGILANDMEVTVSLLSDGADWDLRAYLGNPGDDNGCGGQEMRSETTGQDSVTFSWGESGALANNEDDGTFIAVEIFPKADLCTEGASWTLTVSGNG